VTAHSATEAITRFPCFGGDCTVIVAGAGPAGTSEQAVARAEHRMLEWHEQFSRFEPRSELSRLNADPRETVPVSPMMARFVVAAIAAAELTGGLVDPTLVAEIERAGYADDFDSRRVSLAIGSALAPARAPAAPNPAARWRQVSVGARAGTITRPPGLRLDSGGIAKGLFGDVLATVLAGHESFAVDCAGDVRFGGAGRARRPVQVASPFSGSILHVFELSQGGAATSGIGKRSWLDRDGLPAHHLLDPATGNPAFTGVVQATALAPTAVEAEALAKAALLSGPAGAQLWLPHGGVVVYDDASFDVVAATLD
jgi:thiamine biosynthesis lipoprotein